MKKHDKVNEVLKPFSGGFREVASLLDTSAIHSLSSVLKIYKTHACP